jgi:hypothetical protein
VTVAGGFEVDPAELHAHAGNLEALQQRFEAIASASSFIQQDDEAYGTLCGWISGCLEDRHQRQDSLMAFVAENLGIAAQAIRDTADGYETSDGDIYGSFGELESRLGN